MSDTIVVAEKAIRARVYARYCMAAYNRAKACGKFEKGRVNRAFGLAFKELVTGETRPYNTTLKSCDCADFQKNQKWNNGYCKHIIAKMIVQRAKEYMHEAHMKQIEAKREAKLQAQNEFNKFRQKMVEKAREQDRNNDDLKTYHFTADGVVIS